MILLISTCENKFHEKEFIRPISDIIKNYNNDNDQYKFKIINYKNIKNENIKNSDKIIICGTALIDNEYQNHIEKFKWIKEYKKPLIGICSGSQIICQIFNEKIKSKTEIRFINDIKITKKDPILNNECLKEVYALHNFYCEMPKEFEIIAKNNLPQIIKNKNIYAILFHPEVRNKIIIENFCKL